MVKVRICSYNRISYKKRAHNDNIDSWTIHLSCRTVSGCFCCEACYQIMNPFQYQFLILFWQCLCHVSYIMLTLKFHLQYWNFISDTAVEMSVLCDHVIVNTRRPQVMFWLWFSEHRPAWVLGSWVYRSESLVMWVQVWVQCCMVFQHWSGSHVHQTCWSAVYQYLQCIVYS